jgi:hypothetical protein
MLNSIIYIISNLNMLRYLNVQHHRTCLVKYTLNGQIRSLSHKVRRVFVRNQNQNPSPIVGA